MGSIECNCDCACCCSCYDGEPVHMDEGTKKFYANAFASLHAKYPNQEDRTPKVIDNHLFGEYVKTSAFGPYVNQQTGD